MTEKKYEYEFRMNNIYINYSIKFSFNFKNIDGAILFLGDVDDGHDRINLSVKNTKIHVEEFGSNHKGEKIKSRLRLFDEICIEKCYLGKRAQLKYNELKRRLIDKFVLGRE